METHDTFRINVSTLFEKIESFQSSCQHKSPLDINSDDIEF